MDIFILTEHKGETTTTVGAFQQLGSAIDFGSELAETTLHFWANGPSGGYIAYHLSRHHFEIARVAVMDA